MIAALALLTAPASAQIVPDLYGRDLTQSLDAAEANDNAYARAAGPLVGSLPAGQARPITLTLRAGQDYRLVGVCDRRCGDLDLRLRDPRGSDIAADVRPDDRPVLVVRPTVTGTHTILVGMIECSAPECWFAVNVYAR